MDGELDSSTLASLGIQANTTVKVIKSDEQLVPSLVTLTQESVKSSDQETMNRFSKAWYNCKADIVSTIQKIACKDRGIGGYDNAEVTNFQRADLPPNYDEVVCVGLNKEEWLGSLREFFEQKLRNMLSVNLASHSLAEQFAIDHDDADLAELTPNAKRRRRLQEINSTRFASLSFPVIPSGEHVIKLKWQVDELPLLRSHAL